jgi:hypothetical protein
MLVMRIVAALLGGGRRFTQQEKYEKSYSQ